MGKAKNLTGQRFGKLTMQYPTDKRGDQGSVIWHGVCDCGNSCEVSARRLIRGKVRSCGCLSSPPAKDHVGKTFGRLTVLEYAGTAKELGHAGTLRYWKCRCTCGRETVVGQTELQNGEVQSCGCLQKQRTREALVLLEDTSVVLLERSRDRTRSDNISGATGVSWDARTQSWEAKISFRKKRYWLGRYKNKEEAIRVRQTAEEMHENFLTWYYDVYIKEQSQEANALMRPRTNV